MSEAGLEPEPLVCWSEKKTRKCNIFTLACRYPLSADCGLYQGNICAFLKNRTPPDVIILRSHKFIGE